MRFATALAATKVSRVVVSSDNDEILAATTAFGAGAIRRPANISGHTIMPGAAVVRALDADRPTVSRPAINGGRLRLRDARPACLPTTIGRLAIYEIPRDRSIEIDEEGDLAVAEAKLRTMR